MWLVFNSGSYDGATLVLVLRYVCFLFEVKSYSAVYYMLELPAIASASERPYVISSLHLFLSSSFSFLKVWQTSNRSRHFFFQIVVTEVSFSSNAFNSNFNCSILSTIYEFFTYSAWSFYLNFAISLSFLRSVISSLLSIVSKAVYNYLTSISFLSSTAINLSLSINSFMSIYFTLFSNSFSLSIFEDLNFCRRPFSDSKDLTSKLKFSIYFWASASYF